MCKITLKIDPDFYRYISISLTGQVYSFRLMINFSQVTFKEFFVDEYSTSLLFQNRLQNIKSIEITKIYVTFMTAPFANVSCDIFHPVLFTISFCGQYGVYVSD